MRHRLDGAHIFFRNEIIHRREVALGDGLAHHAGGRGFGLRLALARFGIAEGRLLAALGIQHQRLLAALGAQDFCLAQLNPAMDGMRASPPFAARLGDGATMPAKCEGTCALADVNLFAV